MRFRAAVILVAVLGLGADQAAASYTAKVEADTLTVTGNSASDALALRPGFSAPNTLDLDVGVDGTVDFTFDRATFSAIDVAAGGGDDQVTVQTLGGSLAEELITIDGGTGADTLVGGVGAETFIGGGGNDFVDGNLGRDVARLGTGNDVFNWDPGDTSDVVEGEDGDDLLVFHGSGASESLNVSANGPRVRLLRDIASVEMDLDGLERLALQPFGGADTVTVDGTTGTAVERVDVDLDGFGGTADGQPDAVVGRATDGDDSVEVLADGGIAGLGAEIHATGGELDRDSINVALLGGTDTVTTGVGLAGPVDVNVDGGDGPDTAFYEGTSSDDVIPAIANGSEIRVQPPTASGFDTLAVEDIRLQGLGGADTITAVGNVSAAQLTFDGGAGGDTLRGGVGTDSMLGGGGNDVVDGNQGRDAVLLGSGNDVFSWDPGDGSDSVEGEAGSDVVDFNASNAGESIDVAATGERVRLFRNIASVTLDFDDVEGLAVDLLGGADTIAVNPLTGTDLDTIDVNLSAFGGGGDQQADAVIANGTAEADAIRVRRLDGKPAVRGVGGETRISGGELGLDTLRIQTLGGDDSVEVGDIWDLITPVVDLGADS